MSCTIYLVRHAIAEDRAASGRDADRRLTSEGMAKMRRAAAGLAHLGVTLDVVHCSPLRRARETAEILCEILAPDLRPAVMSELSPGDARQVPAALRSGRAVKSVALVGHEPDLGRLAALLIGAGPSASIEFKKGGVAAIEVDALPPNGSGTLLWLLAPKQLRALGSAADDDAD